MKKNHIIILTTVILLVVLSLFFLTRSQEEESIANKTNTDTDTNLSEESPKIDQLEATNSCFEMQGYEFCTPSGFQCDGGFKEGYRYNDVFCTMSGRDDFQVTIDAGLASTGYGISISDSMIGVRSYDFTNGQYGVSVCDLHQSEGLDLGAEHWLCNYSEDGKNVLTLGIGKSFYINSIPVGRWFEADLLILEEAEDLNEEDYIKALERVVNEGVKIDWSTFEPTND